MIEFIEYEYPQDVQDAIEHWQNQIAEITKMCEKDLERKCAALGPTERDIKLAQEDLRARINPLVKAIARMKQFPIRIIVQKATP